MRVSGATLLAAVAASRLSPAAAFAPAARVLTLPPRTLPGEGDVRCPPLSAGGPPVISNWRPAVGGAVSGVVTNHPTIPDGERITTSPVKNPDGMDEGLVVQTRSGSRYKLTNVALGAKIPAAEARRAKERAAKAAQVAKERAAKDAERKRKAEEKKSAAAAAAATAAAKKAAAATARKASAAAARKPAPQKPAAAAKKSTVISAPEPQTIPLARLRMLAKKAFSLTGTTVGEGGRYLLAGRPTQSAGRAAKIWTAYAADPDAPGVPLGFDGDEEASNKVEALTVKLSPDYERLRLENDNYCQVQAGIFSGRFVRKIDYIPGVTSSDRSLDGRMSALVIEAGQYDLKALLAARNGEPLRGRALRDAAASAGQCIQAVHSSGFVWTDLKTENFVVVTDGGGFDKEVTDYSGALGLPGVKGIDLESAILRGGNPIDYSPEACPPEFARALMGGYGEDFVLEYSYDMWSLGMMLYELSTGVPYFGARMPKDVTKLLCDDTFEADVDAVPDAKLRDLIGRCLSLEPRRRPDITGFLLHPYFITTGFGPISF